MSEQFPNLVKDITINIQKAHTLGNFLAVPWLRFHVPNAECTGLIPGQGSKIPHATQSGQNKTKQKTDCL